MAAALVQKRPSGPLASWWDDPAKALRLVRSVPDCPSEQGLGTAFLALHAAGRAVLKDLSEQSLVSSVLVSAWSAQIDAGPYESAYVACGLPSGRAAGDLVDAAARAGERVRAWAACGVPYQACVLRAGLVFGVSDGLLNSFRKVASAPVASPQALRSAADECVMRQAAVLSGEFSAVSKAVRYRMVQDDDGSYRVVPEWDESKHLRDDLGRFRDKPQQTQAKEQGASSSGAGQKRLRRRKRIQANVRTARTATAAKEQESLSLGRQRTNEKKERLKGQKKAEEKKYVTQSVTAREQFVTASDPRNWLVPLSFSYLKPFSSTDGSDYSVVPLLVYSLVNSPGSGPANIYSQRTEDMASYMTHDFSAGGIKLNEDALGIIVLSMMLENKDRKVLQDALISADVSPNDVEYLARMVLPESDEDDELIDAYKSFYNSSLANPSSDALLDPANPTKIVVTGTLPIFPMTDETVKLRHQQSEQVSHNGGSYSFSSHSDYDSALHWQSLKHAIGDYDMRNRVMSAVTGVSPRIEHLPGLKDMDRPKEIAIRLTGIKFESLDWPGTDKPASTLSVDWAPDRIIYSNAPKPGVSDDEVISTDELTIEDAMTGGADLLRAKRVGPKLLEEGDHVLLEGSIVIPTAFSKSDSDDDEWDEGEHPRDTFGRFRRKVAARGARESQDEGVRAVQDKRRARRERRQGRAKVRAAAIREHNRRKEEQLSLGERGKKAERAQSLGERKRYASRPKGDKAPDVPVKRPKSEFLFRNVRLQPILNSPYKSHTGTVEGLQTLFSVTPESRKDLSDYSRKYVTSAWEYADTERSNPIDYFASNALEFFYEDWLSAIEVDVARRGEPAIYTLMVVDPTARSLQGVRHPIPDTPAFRRAILDAPTAVIAEADVESGGKSLKGPAKMLSTSLLSRAEGVKDKSAGLVMVPNPSGVSYTVYYGPVPVAMRYGKKE